MRQTYLLLLVLCCNYSNAQWSSNASVNNAVCNFTGNQTNVQMVADGTGGYIAVWEDTRNSSTDIYAQRVNATGALLWAADGIPLCTAAFNQLNPKIVTDGAGGAVIAWIDDRNGGGAGNYDIYAQRVNASGVVQWGADGLPVCTATGIQNNQQLLADNSGAMIVWSDGRGGSANADIYAQRLNQAGAPLWTIDGISVCNASSLQNIPQIISDGGAGSAIVAWEDWRNFGQPDIYAQHISNGFTDWTFNGVVICSEPNFAAQSNTKMVADGSGGAIMCWEDKRNFGSNTDLYAQRVNNSGSVQWTSNGIAICTASGIQFSQQMIADAAGGAIITWEDRRTDRDIYAQRINAAGAAQWTADGIPVCNTPDIQTEPQLVARTAGGALFVWTDSRNSAQPDIYAQGLDATGASLWAVNGVPVANEGHAQTTAKLITDGANGAFIAWTDLRTTLDYDIYSSKISAGGTLPLHLLSFDASVKRNDVTLVWNTENEINSSHFDVEVSTDGITYKKLATVKANNVPGKNNYSFIHTNVTDNVLFYRLKQVDLDGRFIYSTTIKITLNKNIQVTVYPNPAAAILQLKNINPLTDDIIQVISADGKLLLQQKVTVNMQLNIKNLNAGFYMLHLIKKDKTMQAFSFVKQ
ncbi:T9SS type A sorting domain-containing protein [Ferruginibacter sp. SUN106]|uniref:T9SS type A sorting domain-containing protein n=1 Tax=Ferruginibacter sp. SUN106 TaxID=2978348 RepID=UPI003D36FF3E